MSQKHILQFCLKGKLIISRQLIFHIQIELSGKLPVKLVPFSDETRQNPRRISSGSCKAISYQLINKFLDMHSVQINLYGGPKKRIIDKYHLKHMTFFFFW